MRVVEVEGECGMICRESERLLRMFLFHVCLGLQTEVKYLEVEYCYFLFEGIVGGIGSVQKTVMMTVRFLH